MAGRSDGRSDRRSDGRSDGGGASPWRSIRRVGGVVGTLALALVLFADPTASRAATLAEAQRAFDQGDVGRAQEIWRGLAASGEAEAAFRLGLMYDLGLGLAPDQVKAFRWYLDAAHRGHTAAQFNVGVMLDAGTGMPRSPTAAATWYARAAAKGFARAEYNLALIYAEGDGLPRNIALARAWMSRAAETLPAAEKRLADLRQRQTEPMGGLIAPAPLATAVVGGQGDGSRTAELVWTSVEEPAGTRYRVELDGPSGVTGSSRGEYVDVSSVAIPLPAAKAAAEPGSGAGSEPAAGPRAWRVLAVDETGHRYAASDWQPLAGDGASPPPGERIAILFRADDGLARAFASELSQGFTGSGFDVETAAVEDAQFAESAVRYFFRNDAPLAEGVASALPGLDGRATLEPDPARAPGTVEIRLHGGPAIEASTADGPESMSPEPEEAGATVPARDG